MILRCPLAAATIAAALLLATFAPSPAGAQIPTFSQVVVFGDSLSDDGNIANAVENQFGFRFPGELFNYADGRFTNSDDTDPPSSRFGGVWHEQLATRFLNLPRASNSLDANGTCFAFGGATTRDGIQSRTVVSNPTPFGGGEFTIEIDNMGQQVSNFIATRPVDLNALFVLWGGSNDLYDDPSPANVEATANRVGALVVRLAQAGARSFLVPNLGPLGAVPMFRDRPDQQALYTNAAASFRDKLNASLDAALASLAGQGITNVRMFRFDIYALYQQISAQPGYYGFANIRENAQDRDVQADQYLFWDDLHPSAATHYQIAAAAARVLAGGDTRQSSLINLSSRARVGTGQDVAIAGFVIRGPGRKNVLLRGLGPSLAGFGVANTILNPVLTVYNASGQVIANNDNWRSNQQDQINATGQAPTTDLESALIADLEPGAYTAVLSGTGGESGIGLVEVYDIDPATSQISRPINVSTRANTQSGNGSLIGGFVIAGSRDRRVLLRAIGPSLGGFGVSGALVDPTLDVFNASGQPIASNDNWRSSQPAEIAATPFAPTQDAESAILLTLPPGAYTAVVRGQGGGTGVAVVEVYDLD